MALNRTSPTCVLSKNGDGPFYASERQRVRSHCFWMTTGRTSPTSVLSKNDDSGPFCVSKRQQVQGHSVERLECVVCLFPMTKPFRCNFSDGNIYRPVVHGCRDWSEWVCQWSGVTACDAEYALYLLFMCWFLQHICLKHLGFLSLHSWMKQM